MKFKNYDLVIFDADDTIRECPDGREYPVDDDQWQIIPQMKKEISLYDWKTKRFGIASNQAPVHFGELTEAKCRSLLEKMVMEAFGFLPPAEAIQYCPHGPKGGCECRKPEPGMLHRIMTLYNIECSKTLFIGDSEADRGAAELGGCDFMWAQEVNEGSGL